MKLTQSKEDAIYNSLLVGMALEDAYIYAGLTEDEIETVSNDIDYQRKWRQLVKGFEFSLLNDLNHIAQKQVKMGKEGATTWMLEKLFPRYSNKPQAEVGEIHLHFKDEDPKQYDTVEIFRPQSGGSDE